MNILEIIAVMLVALAVFLIWMLSKGKKRAEDELQLDKDIKGLADTVGVPDGTEVRMEVVDGTVETATVLSDKEIKEMEEALKESEVVYNKLRSYTAIAVWLTVILLALGSFVK